MPIGDMLLRSVDDSQINTVFPKTFEEYKKWDKEKDELPPEPVFKALFEELAYGEKIKVGRALTRMNYSKSGWKSLIKKTSREIKENINQSQVLVLKTIALLLGNKTISLDQRNRYSKK